jgi:hypothetical protein
MVLLLTQPCVASSLGWAKGNAAPLGLDLGIYESLIKLVVHFDITQFELWILTAEDPLRSGIGIRKEIPWIHCKAVGLGESLHLSTTKLAAGKPKRDQKS